MKVIALLILSLGVVVCEQQTLFAPHYTTYGGSWGVASKTSTQNSLRPAAGVNRSAPVNSSYAKAAPPRNDIWVLDTGAGLTSKNGIFAGPIRPLDAGKGLTAGSLEHGPGLHDSVEPTSGPDFVEDDDCPDFMKDDDPGYPDPTRIERPVFGPHILSF